MKNQESTTAIAPEATPIKHSVFVAGYKEVKQKEVNRKTGEEQETVSIAIILKDVVAKNPLMKTKSNKTGTVFAATGMTLDEIKRQLPLGTPLVGAEWGSEIPTTFGGIYKVEGLI